MDAQHENLSSIESPVFIVGHGRSGTTLIRKILSSHSRISILPETHFMKRVDSQKNIHGTPENFDVFWKSYTSWIRFKYLDIDKDSCLKLIDEYGDRTFQNIFRAVITEYKKKSGKPRGGEKSPSHIRYLPVLFEWFPNARIIIMQRDPRAVIASKLNTPWVRERINPASLRRGFFIDSRLRELILATDTWSNIYNEIVPAWESDPRVLVVSYEKLCDNPQKEVRTICQFLGETFEEEMLTVQKRKNVSSQTGSLQDDRVKQWEQHHKKTEEPISTDSLQKWTKNLSKIEIAIVEARCGEKMKKIGYNPSVSPGKLFISQVLSGFFLVAGAIEARARSLFRMARRRLTYTF